MPQGISAVRPTNGLYLYLYPVCLVKIECLNVVFSITELCLLELWKVSLCALAIISRKLNLYFISVYPFLIFKKYFTAQFHSVSRLCKRRSQAPFKFSVALWILLVPACKAG